MEWSPIPGVALAVGLLLTCVGAEAADPTLPLDRPAERLLPLPDEHRPPGPKIELPPVDLTPRDGRWVPGLRVRLTGIRFRGNTAYTDADLIGAVASYLGRDIDPEELEAVRLALTRYYVERGHINSGAVVPDQDVVGGVITVQIIEGGLGEIEIGGNRRLSQSYLRERIALGAGTPLNVYSIRDRLFLLQQDPRVRRLDASLAPGQRRGEAILRVDVEEEPSRRLYLGVNNHRPPSVGATRAEAEFTDFNLLGFGDTIGLRYGATRGLDDVDVSYAVPLNAHDTSLTLRHTRSDSIVVEAPFDVLDVKSRSNNFTVGVWHPYHKTPREEYGAGASFERRRNQTFLLGEPFAFSAGADENGISRVSAVRLAQSWLIHAPSRILTARSTFSFGTGMFNASNSDGEPDAHFGTWLGQFQWVERFGGQHDEIVFRSDVQFANDPVVSLEQFPVGGANSVRGYRENTFSRDNGLLASLEYRWSLVATGDGEHRFQVALFSDVGRSWNSERPTPEPRTLSSVGAGLRGVCARQLEYQLYIGKRLRKIENTKEDLQDRGIHFQLRWRAW